MPSHAKLVATQLNERAEGELERRAQGNRLPKNLGRG